VPKIAQQNLVFASLLDVPRSEGIRAAFRQLACLIIRRRFRYDPGQNCPFQFEDRCCIERGHVLGMSDRAGDFCRITIAVDTIAGVTTEEGVVGKCVLFD